MRFRDLLPSDLAAVARVNVDTFRATQGDIVPDALLDTLSYSAAEQYFVRLLAKVERQSFIVVAKTGNDVIGYAMAGKARDAELGDAGTRYAGELYGLYVLPRFHRAGVGRRLVTEAAQRLQAVGITSMYVVVFAANDRARQFYEAMGGQWAGERSAQLAGEEVTEVMYGWLDLRTLH